MALCPFLYGGRLNYSALSIAISVGHLGGACTSRSNRFQALSSCDCLANTAGRSNQRNDTPATVPQDAFGDEMNLALTAIVIRAALHDHRFAWHADKMLLVALPDCFEDAPLPAYQSPRCLHRALYESLPAVEVSQTRSRNDAFASSSVQEWRQESLERLLWYLPELSAC